MAIDIAGLYDKLVSHPATLGVFESLPTHEPKSAPGNGVTWAMWIQDISPVQSSGLAATSGRLEFNIRLYTPMIQESQDDIDPEIINALDLLFGVYSGDFNLGATVREIDLLGQFGVPLSAKAGYLNQDSKLFRVMTITLPIIIDDIWDQEN